MGNDNDITENNNVTIITVFHENPGGNKARGHLGTEAGNKASLVLSINYYKDSKKILECRPLKIRSAEKPEPFYIKRDGAGDNHKLVLVGAAEVSEITQTKASVDQIVSYMIYNVGEIKKQELRKDLEEKFEASRNTILERLKTVENSLNRFTDYGKKLIVTKGKQGAIFYKIVDEAE